jgi:peptide deformylase
MDERGLLFNKKDFLIFGLHVVVIVIGIGAFLGFYRKNNNVLQIVQYPDPILREISNPIEHIDNHIITLSDKMIATLRYRTIVDFVIKRSTPRGLAAPQVGILERLVVCGINGEIKVMINPEILAREGIYSGKDDCMSVHKGDNKIIQRSAYVKLKYKGLDNTERILIARNRNAALLEHEIDHLNGVLNIDYWAEGLAVSSAAE